MRNYIDIYFHNTNTTPSLLRRVFHAFHIRGSDILLLNIHSFLTLIQAIINNITELGTCVSKTHHREILDVCNYERISSVYK